MTDKKEFDVLVVGELNVDLILNQLGGLPEIGKEILAGDMVLTLGSSSAIFACNLSVLGARVAFLGKTGRDEFAEKILKDLTAVNVNVQHIIKTPVAATGVTIALNYQQDRAMVTYPGAMDELESADISDDILLRAGHLHVSSVFLQKKLKKDIYSLFQRAKKLGMTTSLDPQWDPEERWDLNLDELLPYIDIFLPNITELKYLTRQTALKSCIDKISQNAHIIAIKNGDEGAYLWNGSELIHQKAFLNERVIDCIGAGDSFNAGFIKMYTAGNSLTDCLEFASLAGAVNTTRPGGITAFRDIETFLTIAANSFHYSFP